MNWIQWFLHIITDFVTDFFGSLAAKKFTEAAKEAAAKAIKLDPEQAKRRFPDNVMQKSHQVIFGDLTDKLDDGLEKALEEYFLSQLGTNQRAEFIIHMAEWAEQNQEAALRFLVRIAKRAGPRPADFASCMRMAVSNDYIQPNETDYPTGWVMNWFGTHNIAQFFRQIGWWRGLGLVFLVWGLLRSKPEDFLNAFTRIHEIYADLLKKGTDTGVATATAVWQGARESAGMFGRVIKRLFQTGGSGVDRVARGTAWTIRYALAVPLYILGAILAVLLIVSAFPQIQLELVQLALVVVLFGVALFAVFYLWTTGFSWFRLLGGILTLTVGIAAAMWLMPELGVVLLVIGCAILFALAGMLTGHRGAAVTFLRYIAMGATAVILLFVFLPALGRIVLPDSVEDKIAEARNTAVRSVVININQIGVHVRRADVPREADGQQTFAKVTNRTPVFEVSFNLDGTVNNATYKLRPDGTVEVLEPGRLLKTWTARPEVRVVGESVLEVVLPDRYGTHVLSNERVFIPERSLKIQNRAATSSITAPWLWPALTLLAKIALLWAVIGLLIWIINSRRAIAPAGGEHVS